MPSTRTHGRRLAVLAAAVAVASAAFAPLPAAARNSISRGGGIKCTWVLVSSVNFINTYKQVCRRGV